MRPWSNKLWSGQMWTRGLLRVFEGIKQVFIVCGTGRKALFLVSAHFKAYFLARQLFSEQSTSIFQ